MYLIDVAEQFNVCKFINSFGISFISVIEQSNDCKFINSFGNCLI